MPAALLKSAASNHATAAPGRPLEMRNPFAAGACTSPIATRPIAARNVSTLMVERRTHARRTHNKSWRKAPNSKNMVAPAPPAPKHFEQRTTRPVPPSWPPRSYALYCELPDQNRIQSSTRGQGGMRKQARARDGCMLYFESSASVVALPLGWIARRSMRTRVPPRRHEPTIAAESVSPRAGIQPVRDPRLRHDGERS